MADLAGRTSPGRDEVAVALSFRPTGAVAPVNAHLRFKLCVVQKRAIGELGRVDGHPDVGAVDLPGLRRDDAEFVVPLVPIGQDVGAGG